MNLLSNASFIKAQLIDHTLIKHKSIILGNEIRFGSKGYYADLIFLKKNYIVSFEIKANNDDLRGLRKQLDGYRKVFDYLYLVVTEKHLEKAINILKKDEGLILIGNNGKIEYLKVAKLIKRLSKSELLHSMTLKFIKEYFFLESTTNKLRENTMLTKKTISDLKSAFFVFTTNRISPKNELFFKERGNLTHIEDIRLLSFNETSELF